MAKPGAPDLKVEGEGEDDEGASPEHRRASLWEDNMRRLSLARSEAAFDGNEEEEVETEGRRETITKTLREGREEEVRGMRGEATRHCPPR